MFSGRVTLLTSFVPPYLVPMFAELAKRVGTLQILVSTRMEPNRPWGFQGEGLPVHVQRTLTVPRTWRHPSGFRETVSLHFPLDTFALLRRHRPDVIVTTEFGFRTLQAVLYRRFNARTAVVAWAPISEVTEQSRGRFREWLRRWLLHRVDAVVVSGESASALPPQARLPRRGDLPRALHHRWQCVRPHRGRSARRRRSAQTPLRRAADRAQGGRCVPVRAGALGGNPSR